MSDIDWKAHYEAAQEDGSYRLEVTAKEWQDLRRAAAVPMPAKPRPKRWIDVGRIPGFPPEVQVFVIEEELECTGSAD